MMQARYLAVVFCGLVCTPHSAYSEEEWTLLSRPLPEEYRQPSVLTGLGTGLDFKPVLTVRSGFVIGRVCSDLTGRWLVGELRNVTQQADLQLTYSFSGLLAIDVTTSSVKFLQVDLRDGDSRSLKNLQSEIVRTERDAVVLKLHTNDGQLAPKVFQVRFAESPKGQFELTVLSQDVQACPDSQRFRYELLDQGEQRTLRISDRHSARTTAIQARQFFCECQQPSVFRSGYKYLLRPGSDDDAVLVVCAALPPQPQADLILGINPNFKEGIRWRITWDVLTELLAGWELRAIRPARHMAARPTRAVIALRCERFVGLDIEDSVVCVAIDITQAKVLRAWRIPGSLGFGRPIVLPDESAVCIETESGAEEVEHKVALYSIDSGDRIRERSDLYQELLAVRDADPPEVIVGDGATIRAASLDDLREPRVIFTLHRER